MRGASSNLQAGHRIPGTKKRGCAPGQSVLDSSATMTMLRRGRSVHDLYEQQWSLLQQLLLLLQLLLAAAAALAGGAGVKRDPDTVAPETTIAPLDIAAAVQLPGWFLAAVEAEAHGHIKRAADEDRSEAACAVVVGFFNSTACVDGRPAGRARACRQAQWAAAEAIAYAGAQASLNGAKFGLIDVAREGGGGAADGRALAAALASPGALPQSSEVALWLFTTDQRYSSSGYKHGYEGACRPADQASEETAEKDASAGRWAAVDSAADRLFSRLLMHAAPFELPAPFTGPQLRDAVHAFCGGKSSDSQLATQKLQHLLGLPTFSHEDARVLIGKGAELAPWTPQRSPGHEVWMDSGWTTAEISILGSGGSSRRRDFHSTSTAPSFSLLIHLLKGEGVQQNDSLADG